MPNPPPPQIPQYELVRQIGRGSYGEVWLARTVTGVYRAVKIVWRGPADNLRPYQREFEGIQKIQATSSSIDGFVAIHHVGLDETAGFLFYVMELADDAAGSREIDPNSYQPKTLRSVMRETARLPVAECLQVGIALAKALEELHSRNLVHRDIKPSNILFVHGKPRLGDMGLVTSGSDECSLVGTDGFLPPEPQYIGTMAGDLYALGKVLYEMSSGKDRTQFPEIPTGLPAFQDRLLYRGLNQAFLVACDNDPRRRFRNAARFRGALEDVAAGKRPALPPVRPDLWRTVALCAVTIAIQVLIMSAVWPDPVFTAPVHAASRSGNQPALSDWIVKEFSPPGITDWSFPLFADFDGDGSRDIITLQEKTLYVISDKAEVLDRRPELPPESQLTMAIAADAKGQARAFVGWATVSNLVLASFNQNLKPVQSYRFTGAARFDDTARSFASASKIVALAYDRLGDLVYANLATGHERKPRGVVCFDAKTGDQKWVFPTAPTVTGLLLADPAPVGASPIVVGSASVWNGAALPNGTDDFHSYIWGLDASGHEQWKFETGGILSHAHPFAAIPPLPREMYVAAARGPDFASESGPEFGLIYRLDLDGIVSRRKDGNPMKYSVEVQIMNWLAASNRIDGAPEVLVTDRIGRLHILDSELNSKITIQIATNHFDSVETYIDAVADLDGDGSPEIVLHSLQKRVISGHNPGWPNGEPNVRLYNDKTIWILDAALHPVGSYLVSAESKRPDFRVEVLPQANGRGARLLAITDRALLLEWRGSRQPNL